MVLPRNRRIYSIMIIQSSRVYIGSQFTPMQLEITDSKITAAYAYGSKPVDKDYGDKRIVPGFIDVHTHGAYGFDTNDANEEGLRRWMKNITSEGVTGICPTTITQSHEVLSGAVSNVAKVVEQGYEGAEILGIHFEGPYLDMVKKGAQPEQYIVKGTIEEFEQYQHDANGLIKIITMACEHDDDMVLTKYCATHGVNVSIGHSGIDYNTALVAIANGARGITHTNNGMSMYSHRGGSGGLLNIALRCKDMYSEIICDGHHVSWAALNTFFTCKGKDKGIIVTDSLLAKGLPAGTHFMFGGNETEIWEDGTAHVCATQGLAGSTLRVNEALRNLVEYAMVPFDVALNACTLNPAGYLKVDDRKGKLAVGYDADIVVLADDYSVVQTYARGVAQL